MKPHWSSSVISKKIKAEDVAAGRIENNTPDASGSEPHQDSIFGQNQASGEEPSNKINLPWWLAGILFLILAAIWYILRNRKKGNTLMRQLEIYTS
jgi:hypothetical protein